jgi:ABC-2 type transport system ATP-binding protein
MTTPALELVSLSKRFGERVAVRSVDLAVRPGEVLAFLGSNGAGKTTTLRMIVGLTRPTGGFARVFGKDVWAADRPSRRLLGYAPDVPLLQEGLTAREHLWFIASLYGLSRADSRRRTEQLLGDVGLLDVDDRVVATFSLGMRRKLALAAALVHEPPLLLLDEPTNGLDPHAVRNVKDFVRARANAGTAVLLTTHILEVAEQLATRVAILERGEVRALGTLDELRARLDAPTATLEDVFLRVTRAPRELFAP